MTRTMHALSAIPPEVTDATGLTSWPDRGSDLAPAFEMTWTHARRRVEIRYEAQDALWLAAELNELLADRLTEIRGEPERMST